MKKPLGLRMLLAGGFLLTTLHSNAQIPVIPLDPNNLPPWVIDAINGHGGNEGGPYTGIKVPIIDDSYAQSCIPLAPVWNVGGNNITPPSTPYVWTLNNVPPPTPSYDIGTCNKYSFVLKAYDKKTVFITENAQVGIGLNNDSPGAVLDVLSSNLSNRAHLKIFGDAAGNIAADNDMNLNFNGYFNLIGGGTNLFSADYNTGNVSMATVAGQVGIGTNAPGAGKLTVNSGNGDGYLGQVSSNSAKALTVYNTATSKTNFVVYGDGTTYIGEKRPKSPSNVASAKLTVGGIFLAAEIFVAPTNNTSFWADYVFGKDYKLMPLQKVKEFTNQEKHLPGIPSQKELQQTGLNVGDMQKKQMEKIEELYLYVIQLQEQIDVLKKDNEKLQPGKSH